MGVKIGHALGATVVLLLLFFVNCVLTTYPSGYKLRCHKSRSTYYIGIFCVSIRLANISNENVNNVFMYFLYVR